MVGIFRRLWGFRGKANPTPTAGSTSQKKSGDNTFFLDPDEAKTLGNIDYMRTPRIVKHTFLDFGAKEKVEVIEQVSAFGRVKVSTENSKAAADSVEQGSNTSSTSSQVNPRRQGGSDMDKFREMARSLKRK